VSIRDLAKQILRETKHLQCKNIPNTKKEVDKDIYKLYLFELLEEKKMQEKFGMNIFFESNIGTVGIYFLTTEKLNKDTKKQENIHNHHILEIDLTSIQKMKSYTVDGLKNIIENQMCKRFILPPLVARRDILKEQKYYERLYRSKSIMNAEDFRAMKITPILINSFKQSDFSAINVAKLYHQNMCEYFKNNESVDECEKLHIDDVHRFYQYKNQYYATATIKKQYHIYQVIDDKIVLFGKCFKEAEIPQRVITHATKSYDKNMRLVSLINKPPSLFDF